MPTIALKYQKATISHLFLRFLSSLSVSQSNSQRSARILIPTPMKIPTRLSMSSPRRLMSPASLSRGLLELVSELHPSKTKQASERGCDMVWSVLSFVLFATEFWFSNLMFRLHCQCHLFFRHCNYLCNIRCTIVYVNCLVYLCWIACHAIVTSIEMS